ncbi:MAG: 5-formyltetrahydrofolate cyclo-ligase [Spirochaetaceae bacterium]
MGDSQDQEGQERKTALRGEIARRIRQMTPEERVRQSGLVRRAVLSLPEWAGSRTVLGFLPLSDEPDLEPLLTAGLEAGKRIGLPRLGGAELRFHGVEDLVPGRFRRNQDFGFREPADKAEELMLPPEEPVLILVPGRAFDRAGRRLGRGGGYYDRFLGTLSLLRPRGRTHRGSSAGGVTSSQILLVGVAFSCQVMDEVPAGSHDVPVDLVATPEGVLDCRLFSHGA